VELLLERQPDRVVDIHRTVHGVERERAEHRPPRDADEAETTLARVGPAVLLITFVHACSCVHSATEVPRESRESARAIRDRGLEAPWIDTRSVAGCAPHPGDTTASHPVAIAMINIFPRSGFDQSVTTPVLIGVLVSWFFTETFGWIFAGLVVPGYLAA